MKAEQVTDPIAHHGEGPVWSSSWGGLRWVDMLAGDILSLADDGDVTRRHVGEIAAVVRPRSQGGAIIGVERGFVLEETDGTLTRLPDVWADSGVRMNEGGCDPHGRFYCGSMAYDQAEGAATLYRLDADRTVHTVLENVTVSNGLEWTADGSRAFYNDTATGQIAVFDYDYEAGLTNRREFVAFPDGGHPDGLTVDAHGGVWTAIFNQGAVHHYAADGTLEDVIDLPVKQATACTFGGGNLDTLFITTSADGLEPGSDPLAGALFRADVGVRGLPVREFAG